ncbi:hypothetical protein V1Y59_21155 [Gordonia sp. PKS22-38]|uniref:ATP-binding protein n=1 Tax=Gordonia prachuapensis TaxID=3115651 RepID=A0ABU7MZ52_9ACTN|nr:hypothetical protein [Gordonia sp. PKS22-38]
MVDGTDPFGVGELRAATLSSWRSSGNRYLEDATTEDDLVTVGYRDRLFTELVANAADAAAAAGVTGLVAIWSTDQGTVHIANTGAPLTSDGVRSLLSLRVSAKSDAAGPRSVGRYGVGFTATAAVADRVEVRSTSGSIVFDRSHTADAIAADDIGATAARAPLLRLAWPTDTMPAGAFDTEVVIWPRAGTTADALMSAAQSQAVDLLLELDGLNEISVVDTVVTIERETVPHPPVPEERGGSRASRRAPQRLTITTSSPAHTVSRTWIQAGARTRWLIEIDETGAVLDPPAVSVLCAPTPTDIELSLPASCITDLPLTPDRRHLHPSADIASAADGYTDLIRAVQDSSRLRLVPAAGRIRNRDDAVLTDAVLAELTDGPWLPAADGTELTPSRAVVFGDLTAELADVLSPIMGDLAHPSVSERRHLTRLRSVGVGEIGLADLAERLIGVERPPSWWRDLYSALSPLVTTAADAEELGTLPVPRSDGRTNIGARGLFLADGFTTSPSWIPTVDPDARHPLIERLGATAISVTDALADPALRQLVDEADDDHLIETADEVFELLTADPAAPVPEWLAGMPIADSEGDLVPADELLLPDSPLVSVLVDDAPFGRVAPDLVARVGVDVLRRVGVGWGFMTVVDDLPVAADHDLPDEQQWWDSLDEPPETLAAVLDLDLVDETRWNDALTLLATDEHTAPLLADRAGYTAWWLRHHAVVDGQRLGWYRAPSDDSVAGVRDAIRHEHADQLAAALGGLEIESAADADTVLAHLGDPDRDIVGGVAADVHAAVVAAARRGVLDPEDLAVPQRVRSTTGDAVEVGVVLDRPWLIQVLSPTEVVLAGSRPDVDDAVLLAEILDLPIASDEVRAEVPGDGVAAVHGCAEATLFVAQWGHDLGRGDVRLHDELWVRLRRKSSERDVRVHWWVDENGVTHLPRMTRPR